MAIKNSQHHKEDKKMKRIHKFMAMVMALVMAICCTGAVAYATEAPEDTMAVEQVQEFSTEALAVVEPRSGVALSFQKDDWYPVSDYNAGTFTASETGTVRIALDAVRYDGTKTEKVTLTIYKVGALGSLSRVVSATVNADATLHVVQTNDKLSKGTKYKVVLSSTSSLRMIVAGYVGIEN